MIFAILGAAKEQGTEVISHLIDKLGIASIITAYGVEVADAAGAIQLAESISDIWGPFDWLGFLAGIGTITFIIKNIISARKTYLEIQLLKSKDKE